MLEKNKTEMQLSHKNKITVTATTHYKLHDRGTEMTSQLWKVQSTDERLNQGWISCQPVCSGARISDNVACVSSDCKLDLVDNKENLYTQQSVDEIFVPPKHRGKLLALYELPYQCCRSSTSKCRAALLGCAQGFAGGVSSPRSEHVRRRLVAAINARGGPTRYWKAR